VKLNHVNLTVDDVPAARRFLERHLGMRRHGERWVALRPVHRPPP
jgi:catechol 2,3-dioxygenase-like lactoylglutathione lyase family enzyme